MNLRPTVDFMALLAESGVPTTEAAMEAELKKEVVAAGSLITNDSDVSPFWRLVRSVVITPALWLIRTLLAGHVLPNTFAATATDAYLDLKAWDVDLTRLALGAELAQLESLARDSQTPIAKLQELATRCTARLAQLAETLAQLGTLSGTLWHWQGQGDAASLATQLGQSSPPDHSQSMTVAALLLSPSQLTFWQELTP